MYSRDCATDNQVCQEHVSARLHPAFADRRALKLKRRDKLVYRVLAEGTVTVERDSADREGADPVLGAFLDFLGRDMERHPGRIRSLDAALRKRIRSLVAKAKVDLENPFSADDE